MGIVANALRPITGQRPRFPMTTNMGGALSDMGAYQGYSRAYMRNEIVFACIEMLATSAAEPHIVGRRWQRQSPTFRNAIRAEERKLCGIGLSRRQAKDHMIRDGFFRELPDHSLVRLLNAPNPFMSRGQLWGTVVMDRCLAGNAYLYKARGAGDVIAELWRLRPDRVRVVPDRAKFIAGYEYRTGNDTELIPPGDIMHFKTRHPLNDYYGMPPLMAIADRVNIDEYMKGFLRGFFERGGTGPGAILTSKAALNQEQKDLITEKFEQRFNNPQGMSKLLVLDNTESTYQQAGLNRGLRDALPKEIDNMQEARIALAFGIPGSILGLLIGYESSSYANKRQDWAVFWDLTMTPLLSDLDDVLNLSVVPDFGGIDEVMFDLSDIRALQEDVDKLHDRYRKDLGAGGISLEEFREATGRDPDIKEGTFYVPANVTAVPAEEIGQEPEPPPTPPPMPELPEVEGADTLEIVARPRCPTCGRRVGANVQVGAELPCRSCHSTFVVSADGREGVRDAISE
ncbi:hypothetical protein AMK68_00090 [candidate division KD3-62 bacterium DG_56]|uniref:Phage portal protein n=1 Tax=candidate division KD3-62 bacterium DG_56 TaxID=1704032 RepID=A0A0S7XQT7_9BACT|nr:MAG: hypothetical protein AMK68_00090 [candidate division KD3-62 bacterium DG_56]